RGTAAQRHHVELYGSFPNASILSATFGVMCNRGLAPNVTIDARASNQLNISFDDIGEARCTFVLGYGTGQRTNLWGPVDLRSNDALTGFGAYHWNTETRLPIGADDTLASGQWPATRAGFDVVRVGMSPLQRQTGPGDDRYQHNLDLLATECPVGAPFLPCAARSDGYRRLFSAPGARIIVLTAADSTSWGDRADAIEARLL